MNNLSANYERILEVLQKISKEQLLAYQRRRPKVSDLELISLSLTAEFMGIDSENDLFRKLPKIIFCFDNLKYILSVLYPSLND